MERKCKIWLCSLSIIWLLLICSCGKKDTGIQLPSVTTADVVSITSTTATSGGTITSNGGSTITATGVCWNTTPSPVISGSKTSDGTSVAFSSTLSGLIGNTTYFVRAYATNVSGTGYGNEISFTTLPDAIKIGSQTWMDNNLNVTHYLNGDPIVNVIDGAQWLNLTKGAYCDYDNTSSNSTTYGHLYNWYAVTDSRNICPIGWHVATVNDWQVLTNYLGGLAVAGGKMKETGIVHWHDPNVGATNESGFTALPGGHRYSDAAFFNVGINAYWWTSTEASATNANYRLVSQNGPGMAVSDFPKVGGFSVRCVKN